MWQLAYQASRAAVCHFKPPRAPCPARSSRASFIVTFASNLLVAPGFCLGTMVTTIVACYALSFLPPRGVGSHAAHSPLTLPPVVRTQMRRLSCGNSTSLRTSSCCCDSEAPDGLRSVLRRQGC